MSAITTSDVKVGEFRFRLNQSGDAATETVLWLHGSGPGATGLSNWEGVINSLAGDFHHLAPEIIGYGDSSHPDPPPQGIDRHIDIHSGWRPSESHLDEKHDVGGRAANTRPSEARR